MLEIKVLFCILFEFFGGSEIVAFLIPKLCSTCYIYINYFLDTYIHSFLQQIFIEPLQTAECCARLWRCYTNKTESFSLKRAGLVGEAKQEDR